MAQDRHLQAGNQASAEAIEAFIERWRDTGGNERAVNEQGFVAILSGLHDDIDPSGRKIEDRAGPRLLG